MNHNINHPLGVRQNKTVRFSDQTLQKVDELLSRYPSDRKKSALIPLLHLAQEEFEGYLSVDTMDYVATLLNLQPIEVYEVASFYTQFYLQPVGKYVIEICRTGPCAICGGIKLREYLEKKLEIGIDQTTPDGLFTLKSTECLGSCGTAPVMQINTQFYENLTEERIDAIIEELKQKAETPKEPETRWINKLF